MPQGGVMRNVAHQIPDIGSEEADLGASTVRYARRFEGPSGEWLLSRQTAALRELMAPWPKASVLDIGGGHAQLAGPLLDDGHRVSVLASSAEALGRVRNLSHPNLRTCIGSITTPPFSDRSFDVVVSFRILSHIGQWQRFMTELCRVARQAVIFDFPTENGFNALQPLLFGLKKRIEGDTRQFQSISRIAVRDCLSSAGFRATAEVGQFVLPMVFHRIVRSPTVSGSLERMMGGIGLSSRVGTPVVLRAERAGEN
jgi:hypothetical protein